MCDSGSLDRKKVQLEIKQEMNFTHQRHQIVLNKVDFDRCKLNESMDLEWMSSPVDGSPVRIKWSLRLFPNGIDRVTNVALGFGENLDLTNKVIVSIDSKVKDPKVKLGVQISFIPNNNIYPGNLNERLCALFGKSLSGELEGKGMWVWGFSANRIPFDQDKTTLLVDLMFSMKGNDVTKCEQNSQQNQILLKDLKTISELEELYDFTIVCGGEEIPCHKTVMAARSDILRAMLVGDTLERQENKVVIEDTTPDLIKVLVKHMYDGQIPQNISEIAYELIYVAVKYQFHVLIKACEGALGEKLNDENAISTLIMVDRYVPQSSIRAKVLEFITSNAEEVIKSKDMEKFIRVYPILVMDLYRSMAQKNTSMAQKLKTFGNV